MKTTLKELFYQFHSSESVDSKIIKSAEYLKASQSLSQTEKEITDLLNQIVSKSKAAEIIEKYENLYRNCFDTFRYEEFKLAFTTGIMIGMSVRNEKDDMFISKVEKILEE